MKAPTRLPYGQPTPPATPGQPHRYSSSPSISPLRQRPPRLCCSTIRALSEEQSRRACLPMPRSRSWRERANPVEPSPFTITAWRLAQRRCCLTVHGALPQGARSRTERTRSPSLKPMPPETRVRPLSLSSLPWTPRRRQPQETSWCRMMAAPSAASEKQAAR